MRSVVLLIVVCVIGLTAWADFAATPHVAGDFNGWDAAANPMVETATGSGVWTFTVTGQTPDTRQEFKVTDGTWDSNYPGVNSWYYTDGAGEVTITFNANIVLDGWLPEQYRLGTSTDPGTWTLAGGFGDAWDWNNGAAEGEMTSLGDGIYMLSKTLSAGTYQWKAVVTGSWDSISQQTRSINTADGSTTVTEPSEVVDFYVDALTGRVGIGGDIDLSFLSRPFNPIPSNGQIVGTSLTALNWTNPDPNNPADTITCDVYFLNAGTSELTYDPNMGPTVTDPGVVQIANDITAGPFDLNDALVTVLPLQDDHYYYWAVHSTDPNTPGSGVTTQGNTWYFFTGDAAPVPSKPVDQYMWLGQDDSAYDGGENNPNVRWFQVTATYTDDGKSPIVDANFVNLNWGWDPDNLEGNGAERGVTEVSDVHTPGVGGGTVTAIYKTEYNAADPNYTTDLPGLWNIRLEVTDATGTVQGESGYHRITETCGQAAFEDPLDDFDGTYDSNGDCIINLVDFADFAKEWLYQGVKYE